MKLAILFILTLPTWAATIATITLQEALYSGVSGITRTNAPFSVGIPISDAAAITSTSVFGLTNAAAGQFRVLGCWTGAPSTNATGCTSTGRIKWVLVDGIYASFTGGSTPTVLLTNSGSGNFGGSDMATDGTPIIVSTNGGTCGAGSAICGEIKKANHNGIDRLRIGGTTIVAASAGVGFVVMGPASAGTTCGTCTTAYQMSNDGSSTCTIEENGPVKAVIKCTGAYIDGSANTYLRGTNRYTFTQGSASVKVTAQLRNADHGSSASFATAYKGLQAWEYRTVPNIASGQTYTFGTYSGTSTAAAAGTNTYIYQGKSTAMQITDWCGGSGCIDYTSDTGWTISNNGSTVTTGTSSQPSAGWGDISNGSGAGIEIGHYQAAANYPKSLEFNSAGLDIRVGLYARQNTSPVYIAWPQYNTYDFYLIYHAAAPASLANEFLKMQHYLLGRTTVAYYNSTAALPYTIAEPTVVDAWMTSVVATASPATISPGSACCLADISPKIYRYYYWATPGGNNQEEFRFGGLYNFLARGYSGYWLESANFYRYQLEMSPRADGFTWRGLPAETDRWGQPTATSANSTLAMREANWMSNSTEHSYSWGENYYYFLTGDETIGDRLRNSLKEWTVPDGSTYSPTGMWQTGTNVDIGGLFDTRAIGSTLSVATHHYQFLKDIGDSDAATVLVNAKALYTNAIAPVACISGYPAGSPCPHVYNAGAMGTSRTRGVHWGPYGYNTDCTGTNYRGQRTWHPPIMVQGILDLNRVAGTGWAEYLNAQDLAYGIGRWTLSEGWVDDGTSTWNTQGFVYTLNLDAANTSCSAEVSDPNYSVIQRTSYAMYAKYLTDGDVVNDTQTSKEFRINALHAMSNFGMGTADFAGYELPMVIQLYNRPAATTLQSVAITTFTDNGGGSYTIHWTVPRGTQSYRIKWGLKPIVDWLNFNPHTQAFGISPANYMPWFAATNSTNPSPGTVGADQSVTIATGQTGLTASNFSVKAYIYNVVWNQEWSTPVTASASFPGTNQWWKLLYDDNLSRQTYVYTAVGTMVSNIYSSDLYAWDSTPKTWTHVGGNGTITSTTPCAAGVGTWPMDRHPYNQMAIDTSRNLMYLWNGVCSSSVADPAGMYYWTLNATPASISITHPIPTNLPTLGLTGAGIYDPDDDVLVYYGEGAGPAGNTRHTGVGCFGGTLTGKRSQAGCANLNDWTPLTALNGVGPQNGENFPGMIYDTVNQKVLAFGGMNANGDTFSSETWVYDVPSKTWAQRTTVNGPTFTGPVSTSLTYNPTNGKMYFHNSSRETWAYDYPTNTWSFLCTSVCGGMSSPQSIVYDAKLNGLVGMGGNGAGGLELVHGTLPSASAVTTPPAVLTGTGSIRSSKMRTSGGMRMH